MHFIIPHATSRLFNKPQWLLLHTRREALYRQGFVFQVFKVSLRSPSKQYLYVNRNSCLDMLHLLFFMYVHDQRITAFTVKKTQLYRPQFTYKRSDNATCSMSNTHQKGTFSLSTLWRGVRSFLGTYCSSLQDTLQSIFTKILPVQWWRSLKKWQLTKRRSHSWEWSFCWNDHQGNQRWALQPWNYRWKLQRGQKGKKRLINIRPRTWKLIFCKPNPLESTSI